MKAEEFFNNGFGEDCEKVHRNHVIELMTNFAKHYYNEQLILHGVSICVCGTEIHREIVKRGDGMIYCGKCDKPY